MKRRNAVTDAVTSEATIKETSDSLIATMKELDRLQKLTITFTLINIALIFWVLLLL
tara:strand:+ start:333 stop:503 length:171 start_codon:yes stop_codon:yes gene_type:complete